MWMNYSIEYIKKTKFIAQIRTRKQIDFIENKGFIREPEIRVDTSQPDKKPNQLARQKMRPMHARHDHRNERDAMAQKNSVV